MTKGFDRLFLRSRKLPNGCIVLARCGHYTSYRSFSAYGLTWKSHRLIYRLCVGPMADDLMVLHGCDTPGCVNPVHLRPGTNTDNMADMVARGRSIRGSRHYRAILTETDVRTIRRRIEAGESMAAVGRDFGISAQQARRIHVRTTWAWLPDEPQEAIRG